MYSRNSSTSRGYGYKWQQARKEYLKENPYCLYCARDGKSTQSNVVDHIVPHKGNEARFWDVSNWQALCKECHDSEKAMEESGKTIGCDANGMPKDKGHHWA